jgi:hypothetical protein
VAEYGNKFLPQLGHFAFPLQADLGNVASLQKVMLVSSAVGGLDQRDPNEQSLPGGIPHLNSVRDHRERLASRRHHFDCELIEKALHPQQRRNVGFKIDAARHVEEVAEPFACHLFRRVADPAEKRVVHAFDASIRKQRNVRARRVLEHVFEIVDP